MRPPSRFLPLLGLATAAALAAGCADRGVKKVTLNGTVSYKGQPVSSGILRLVGPEGAYSAASVQPDGTFIVTDVVPGETRVGVMESPSGSGSSSAVHEKKAAPAPKPAPPLPAKYREPETSGLVYTIAPDMRELHIEIR
jgi:hypothetical protein